jgi:selenide, water dikinase
VLQPLKGIFPPTNYPDLLIGLAEPDDAAVMRITDQQAIISTMDFFPPVVDDPYAFGAIAAANALSDIYAMGGEPLMAINLVAYPDGLGLDLLTTILRGGAEKVKEAGAVIAGGHTVTDKEPKYGLAVTGVIHPDHIIPKGGAQIGDHLILTKSLGTGVITTALKRDLADTAHVEAAIASMSRLNRDASRLARQHHVHGMTDITGYSLLGHGHEMAHLANVDFHITLESLSWLPGAQDYAAQEIFPGGTGRNRDYFSQWAKLDPRIPESIQNLLFDPQTSGGLLMAVPADSADKLLADLVAAGETAQRIGLVTAGTGILHITQSHVGHQT